jgi:hypothetical protein
VEPKPTLIADDTEYVDEVPDSPTDYSGPIPHDAEED